jgi:flagellar hook-associated protein 1 FlgK
MLSTGVSGLMAFQTALDTTSHNISNSATPGYSRQSVDLSAAQPNFTGGGYIGSGVNVTTVSRAYNDLIATQVRSSSSGKSQWDTYSSMADSVNNLFGDSSTGLSTTLQNFFNAFQSVANSPQSSSERQVLLSQAQTLVDQMKAYGTRLNDLGTQVNSQLGTEATAISGLAQNIASLNAQITAATGRGGNPPNDMLDQRDTLIDQLSTHTNVSTVKQSDGSVNVFIGSGQPLVVGAVAAKVVATADPYDPTRSGLSFQSSSGTTDITSALSGGAVGGLLSVRAQVLDPASSALGQVAVTLSTLINQQQNAGMDLHGSLGANMFTVGGVDVLANKANAGSASPSVTRSDPSALTGSNYLLTKTASGWALQNTSTGAAVTMTGAGTVGSPFVADGLSITLSGTATTGDRFLIRPTSSAVTGMDMSLKDPNGIAAAAPIIATASSANTGKATITQGAVVNASNAQLRSPITIQFLSATTYTTDGGTTTNTYTSGQPITVNGWQATITGTPATGDTFTVKDNTGGTGDNRNALLLGNLLNKDYLSAGTTSVNDLVGQWVADIGVKSNQAQSNLSIQTALHNDNISAQQSVSGVNIDEEAANLLRYQQAYTAAAQVIATSNKLFDSLMLAFH